MEAAAPTTNNNTPYIMITVVVATRTTMTKAKLSLNNIVEKINLTCSNVRPKKRKTKAF